METVLIPSTLALPMPKTPRSAGIHVSSIIRSIAMKSGILAPEYVEDFDLIDVSSEVWWDRLGEANKIRICMGLAWEEWYLQQLHHVVDHPGEMEVEGIYMTHDGESLDTVLKGKDELALHEVKLTYKSLKTVGDLVTQWLWLAQTKAYCKGLGTNVAYLHVLFVCGDYKYPISPQLKVWRITYTPEELADNWEMMTGYVRQHQGE